MAILYTNIVKLADCATLVAPAALISIIVSPANLTSISSISIRLKMPYVWPNVLQAFGLTQPFASAAFLTAKLAMVPLNISASHATPTSTSMTTNASTAAVL